MHFLGFYIRVYDDRPDLNTIKKNRFASEKIVVDYDRIADQVSWCSSDHVVIMTMGYQDDLTVFRQLMHKDLRYLGMLGSERKIEALFCQLAEEGITKEALQKFFIPVGLQIYSKTAEEIAVSIAAQMILEKNRAKRGGRTAPEAGQKMIS